MTVREYLTFVASIKTRKLSRADRAMRVDHVMKRTQVDDMANRDCGKLSKGYRQRVGLAQALIHDPEVLILDEPTAGLDPKQIMDTRDLIRSLAGEHTVVLSTHILPEVAQTCQRVVIISRGRVVAEDTPENLTRQLKGATSIYLQVEADGDAEGALAAVPGVQRVSLVDQHERETGFEVETMPDVDIRRDLARAIVDRGWGLLELRPNRMSLEEVFLQLTTTEDRAAASAEVVNEPAGPPPDAPPPDAQSGETDRG
jgi:ABC-2 type transport system ATP-binding protein